MTNRSLILVALAACCGAGALSLACKKKSSNPTPSGAPTSSAASSAPSAAGVGSSGAGGAGGVGGNAAGDTPVAAQKITECPKSLEGSETADRTITKECGAVQVTGEYSISGTLTLEAGAQLVFRDGGKLLVGYNDTSKLVVKGTAEAPVTFTTSGDKVPGVWNGIELFRAPRSTIEHLVVEYAGQEDAAALVVRCPEVKITDSTFKGSKGSGVLFRDDGTAAAFSGNTFADDGKFPVAATPEAIAGFGPNNTFPKGTAIKLEGGKLEHTSTWAAESVPYAVLGEVDVDGQTGDQITLTIAPGAQFAMGTDGQIVVGYGGPAVLKAVGTKEQPILFTAGADDKKPGAWWRVAIYGNGDATIDWATFEYAGRDDSGALEIHDGTLTELKDVTFKKNTFGVSFTDAAKAKVVDENNFDGNEKGGVYLYPSQVAALGLANIYGKNERLVLDAGKVSDQVTWHPQTAPVYVKGEVELDTKGVFTIEAGASFVMAEGTKFTFGPSQNTVPHLAGTPEKPISFKGERDEAGSWDGLTFMDNVRDADIANVVVRNAAVGMTFKEKAAGKITNLMCAKCTESALTWGCDSKVTPTGTKNTDGTPKGDDKPSCN
jgi:hypothetical protein